MAEVEDLGGGDHFRRLFVVTPNLGQGFLHGLVFFCALTFHQGDRDAVDEEDVIGSVGVVAVGVFPLLGDVEGVPDRLLEIDEGDVALALFSLDVNRALAAEPGQDLRVALDVVPDRLEAVDDVVGQLRRHDPRVEVLELLLEEIVEQQAGLAPPECRGLLLGDDGPAGLAGVARE